MTDVLETVLGGVAGKLAYARQLRAMLLEVELRSTAEGEVVTALLYNVRIVERMQRAGRATWMHGLVAAESADYLLLGRVQACTKRVQLAIDQYKLAVPVAALDFSALATVGALQTMAMAIDRGAATVATAADVALAGLDMATLAAADPVAGLVRAIDAVTVQLYMRARSWTAPKDAVQILQVQNSRMLSIVRADMSDTGAMRLVLLSLSSSAYSSIHVGNIMPNMRVDPLLSTHRRLTAEQSAKQQAEWRRKLGLDAT